MIHCIRSTHSCARTSPPPRQRSGPRRCHLSPTSLPPQRAKARRRSRARRRSPIRVDTVDLEVVKTSLSSIVQEIRFAVSHSFSTNDRHRRTPPRRYDECRGDMVARPSFFPFHVHVSGVCARLKIRTRSPRATRSGRRSLWRHPRALRLWQPSPVIRPHPLIASPAASRTRAYSASRCRTARRAASSTRAAAAAVRYVDSATAISTHRSRPTAAPTACCGDSAQLRADRSASSICSIWSLMFGEDKILACFRWATWPPSSNGVDGNQPNGRNSHFGAKRFIDDGMGSTSRSTSASPWRARRRDPSIRRVQPHGSRSGEHNRAQCRPPSHLPGP